MSMGEQLADPFVCRGSQRRAICAHDQRDRPDSRQPALAMQTLQQAFDAAIGWKKSGSGADLARTQIQVTVPGGADGAGGPLAGSAGRREDDSLSWAGLFTVSPLAPAGRSPRIYRLVGDAVGMADLLVIVGVTVFVAAMLGLIWGLERI
jgi:hypothetical protein